MIDDYEKEHELPSAFREDLSRIFDSLFSTYNMSKYSKGVREKILELANKVVSGTITDSSYYTEERDRLKSELLLSQEDFDNILTYYIRKYTIKHFLNCTNSSIKVLNP